MHNRVGVLYVLRTKFLVPNTIGIIPPNGYRRADKHSQKSIEWLLYCEREIGREIVHAGRTREFRLPEEQLVPALPSEEGPTAKRIVFEYQGCYLHGCPRCFTNNRESPKNKFQQTYAQAYETTRIKVARMRSLGYEVREM